MNSIIFHNIRDLVNATKLRNIQEMFKDILPDKQGRVFYFIHTNSLSFFERSLTEKNFKPDAIPEILSEFNDQALEIRKKINEMNEVLDSNEIKEFTKLRKNIDIQIELLIFYYYRYYRNTETSKPLMNKQIDIIHEMLTEFTTKLRFSRTQSIITSVWFSANDIKGLMEMADKLVEGMVPRA